jgi:hypothetical protein
MMDDETPTETFLAPLGAEYSCLIKKYLLGIAIGG